MAWHTILSKQPVEPNLVYEIDYGIDGVLIAAEVRLESLKVVGSDTALVIRTASQIKHVHIKHAGADSVLMQSSRINLGAVYVDHPKAIVPYEQRHPDGVQFVPPTSGEAVIEDCHIGLLVIEAPDMPELGFRGVQGLTGFDCPVVRLTVDRLLILTDVNEHGISFTTAVNCVFGGAGESYIRSYSGKYKPCVVLQDRKGIGEPINNQLINIIYSCSIFGRSAIMQNNQDVIESVPSKIVGITYDAAKELGIKRPPRGIRNNNPLNLRHLTSVTWQGELIGNEGRLPSQKKEQDFCVFKHPKYGIRAAAMQLLTYQRRDRLKTTEQMISKYAPPSENNTVAYINFVTTETGIDPKKPVSIKDFATAKAIVKAMIKKENGIQPYPDEIIDLGLSMAGMAVEDEQVTQAPKIVSTENIAAGTAGGGVVAMSTIEMVQKYYLEHQDTLKGVLDTLESMKVLDWVQIGLLVAILAALGYIIYRRREASFLGIR
jgi:hypothetical protein